LVGKSEGKKLLGKRRSRWEDSIKMDLKEMGFEGIAGFMWLMIEASGGLLRTL
jgi:hypothetical protein